ncbi:hypothetical protein NECAME_06600 [Necator americanus]|uniref:Transporter, major facilitator family protein n=1 Tax=Necator americanus TaxID=51031 RepID=W2TTD5_NECAM|nr:hypothetical protein NECAME_06600 [Necator americanus]ETN85053.1 hypothetical protein NECAME_06600 [Necator americanus]
MELEKMDAGKAEAPGGISGSSSSDEAEMQRSTDWNAVTMAGFITFLAAVENTVVGMSEWPYMHTIDLEATSQFFGLVSSVSKMPLIVGRLIAFASCCLYLCVELLPSGRRFLMLFCYFLFGVASSSSTVLRAYIAAVSTTEDRARAYSAIVVANMLSVIIGPICQLAFSNMPYPGYELVKGFLKFHIYSAPIWIASATNFVSIAIIVYGLRDAPTKVEHKDENLFDLKAIKEKIEVIFSMDLAWSLVILCWMEKIVINLSVVTLHSIVSPLVMISFGWDGQKTVKILAVCMGFVGVLSICVATAFIFCRLGNIVSPRISFLIAVLVSVVMYVLTYPYEMTSHKMYAYNATTGAGCNPKEYTWCDTAYATWAIVFLPVICVVMGVGVPTSMISLDTIYSKILGNIDQSMMQGAIVVAEDIILILGPLYAASLFSYSGQGTLWFVNAIITIGGILLWLSFFPKLKRFK